MITRVNNATFLLIESIIPIYQHENTSTYLLHPKDLGILDCGDMDFGFNFEDIDFDILGSFDSFSDFDSAFDSDLGGDGGDGGDGRGD
ncbi:MAG: hypothetical protein PHN61_14585 [Methanothrix sp.]|nr:hypothetical protein [Methanothrix sp.]